MIFSKLFSVSLLATTTGVFAAPIDISAFIELSRRHGEDDATLAQGLNFLFQSLNIQSDCIVGQNACVGGRLAVCSPEGNFEVQPSCPNGQKCLASPGLNAQGNILIGCTTEDSVNQAIVQLGGTGGIAVDNGITVLPTNIEVATSPAESTPTATATGTDSTATATETPSGTDSSSPAPTETDTCPPDDGDDDGDIPTFEPTLGEPFPTEEPSGTQDPSATPTEDPNCPVETDEPELPTPTDQLPVQVTTSVLTLILVPNPTSSGAFITSTFTGDGSTETTTTETATATTTSSDEYATATASPSDSESSSSSTSTPVTTTSSDVIIPGPTTTINAAIPPPSSPSQGQDVNVIGTGAIPADIIALPVTSIAAARI